MTRLIIRWLINAAALWAAAELVSGIGYEGWSALLIVALIFGLVNALIRPVLSLLTCPLQVLTLGLFTIVINALMLLLTSWLADQLKDTAITVNSIRVTNVRIDIDQRYPGAPFLMRKIYSIKSKFAIAPEKMAETYTFLATSAEVKQITGTYFDDPQHIVTSSAYSRNPENIEQLMSLTWSFIKPLENERSS